MAKQSVVQARRRDRLDIRFGDGIAAIGDLLDLSAESDIVSKDGAYYTFEDQSLGQGRERARQALIDRGDLKSKIEALVATPAGSAADSSHTILWSSATHGLFVAT